MTTPPERLGVIRRGVEKCELSHAGQEFPFCETYGCTSMREVLTEVDLLRDRLALAEQVVTAARMISRDKRATEGVAAWALHDGPIWAIERSLARLDETTPP